MTLRRGLASAWASVVLTLLSFAMLCWTYQTGRELGMDTKLSTQSWARAQYSTAIAISRLDYGAPRYLIFQSVWSYLGLGGFRDGGLGITFDPQQGIDNARGKAIDRVGGPDVPVYLRDWGDDKGNADYFMLAFSIFGFSIMALYSLYFLILGVSVSLFVAQFFGQLRYLIFAPLFLAAHHIAVTTVPDSLITSVVHDAHFLPALGCLSALHLAILLSRPESTRFWFLPAALAQLAIIVLVIDGRPSGIWLVYFSIAALLISLAGLLWRGHGWRGLARRAVRRGLLAALIVLAPAALSTYQQLAYDKAYTVDGVQSHMVWHALLMGLSVHPDAKEFGFSYTDMTSYTAVYNYFKSQPELARDLPERTRQASDATQDAGMWARDAVGYRVYEQVGRATFLSFVQAHPLYALQSFLLYKPKYLLDQLLWQSGLSDTWPNWVDIEAAHRPWRRDTLNVFSLPASIVVVLSVVVAFAQAGARARGPWIGLTGLLFLASLLPSILVAPIYYELQVVFATALTLVYAVAAAGLLAACQLLLKLGSVGQAARTRRPQVAALAGVALGLVLVTTQAQPFGSPTTASAAAMPTQYPVELATDSLGQIWLLAYDNTRWALPDWETFQTFHDDRPLRGMRRIGDHEIEAWRWAGIAGSVLDRVGQPADVPQSRGPLPGLGISIGPVDIADDARNIAKGRRATQSDGDRRAPRAVDGNTSGLNEDASFAVATDPNPGMWWQVDLETQQWISDIQVWPRTDVCCHDRLHNVLIFVSDSEPSSADPYELRLQPDVTPYFVLGRAGTPTTIPINRSGRFVRIQKTWQGFLDIAEVKVWGVTADKPRRR